MENISNRLTISEIKSFFIWVLPALFLIDNILGVNGYQFTIKGVSIRIILFFLSIVILTSYSIFLIHKEKLSFSYGENIENSFWKYIKPVDVVVAIFLFLNFIWATIVPYIMQGSIKMALMDAKILTVLLLYFPCSFLSRIGYFPLKKFFKLYFALLVLLGLWHSVMYIGDVLCPGFYAKYYDFIDIISFGTAVRTDVIYGYGMVRIIQVTSVFLIPALFLALAFSQYRKTVLVLIPVLVFSILVTFTKSIWFGALFGLLLLLILVCLFDNVRDHKVECALLVLSCLVISVILNYTVFDNMIFSRALNTFVVSEEQYDNRLDSIQEHVDDTETVVTENSIEPEDLAESENVVDKEKDLMGTLEANQIRAFQKDALIHKWSGSKILGYGYGAYSEECIRHSVYPYIYEYTLPAMLMKLGIIGLSFWFFFVIALIVFAVKSMRKRNRRSFFYWISCSVAFAMSVQTNPFLFTFTGISIIVFLCLCIVWSELEC